MKKLYLLFTFLVLIVVVTAMKRPLTIDAQSEQIVYLPTIFSTEEPSCEVVGTSYNTLPIIPPAYTGDPTVNHEFNLGFRGYELTTAPLQLVNYGPIGDVNAPQFNTLFTDNRLPTFVQVYQRVRWVNGQPIDTQSSWGSTVLGLGVISGEIIEVPNSGYDIGNGYQVMVLYAESQRITLKYTREDSVAFGYTIYIENVCVEPDLLALYEAQHDNGRNNLPALSGNQPLGRAIGSEIKVAVRDTGHFLDPRSCNSWWQAYSAGC